MKLAHLAVLGALEGCAKKAPLEDPVAAERIEAGELAAQFPEQIEELSEDVKRAIAAAQEELDLGQLEKTEPVIDRRGGIGMPYPAHVIPREDWNRCEGENLSASTTFDMPLSPGTCVTYVPVSISAPQNLRGMREVPGYEHIWYEYPDKFDIYDSKSSATHNLTLTAVQGETRESPLCWTGTVDYRYLKIRQVEGQTKKRRGRGAEDEGASYLQTVSMEWALHHCPGGDFSTFVLKNDESIINDNGWVLEREDLIYPDAVGRLRNGTVVYNDLYTWTSNENEPEGFWVVHRKDFAIKDQLIENFEELWAKMAQLEQAAQ